ncbi:MAG: hypothetical protein NZ772_05005 [Cyanobacteria bacterium]|nr:hypothetical protein [Cyanobacteriota bacterium]MDW8200854.1 hypothetical protein [Cyanobacteriota bacterium SKYGB_h_bin112]
MGVVVLAAIVPATGQSASQAQVTDILDGNRVYIQNRQVPVNAVAKRGETVSTKRARAQLSFNTGAIVRLSQHAVLTVGNDCIPVQQGTMLVGGARKGCTNSVVVGVRSTTYVLSVAPDGNEDISVLEGEVEVRSLHSSAGGVPVFQPVRLRMGQAVAIGHDRKLRAVRRLSQSEYNQLITSDFLNDYRDNIPHLPRV